MARQMAKQHRVKTALSLSDPNMVTYFKEGLCAIIDDQVDILFCNEREALLFTSNGKPSRKRKLFLKNMLTPSLLL